MKNLTNEKEFLRITFKLLSSLWVKRSYQQITRLVLDLLSAVGVNQVHSGP